MMIHQTVEQVLWDTLKAQRANGSFNEYDAQRVARALLNAGLEIRDREEPVSETNSLDEPNIDLRKPDGRWKSSNEVRMEAARIRGEFDEVCTETLSGEHYHMWSAIPCKLGACRMESVRGVAPEAAVIVSQSEMVVRGGECSVSLTAEGHRETHVMGCGHERVFEGGGV